jgi:predicted double-glycine peptidase
MRLIPMLCGLVAMCIAAVPSPGAAQVGSADVPVQAGGGYSVPVASLKEARQRRTIIQQFDFSCGSAAIATLLTHHYRFPVTEQAVFEAMFNSGDPEKIKVEGFSLLDMKRFLESHGFQADGFEATLEQLGEAGLPAIALINEQGYNHFVVIKGLREGRVLVGDPASGTRAFTQKSFEALWSNRILFVVSNRQDLALFNTDADWRTVPRAPLVKGIARESLAGIVIPKLGPADH